MPSSRSYRAGIGKRAYRHNGGLSESATHSLLQPIGTSTRQHLVDTDHVERVDTDSDVVGLLTSVFGHVLVSVNTGSLQSLGSDLVRCREACRTPTATDSKQGLRMHSLANNICMRKPARRSTLHKRKATGKRIRTVPKKTPLPAGPKLTTGSYVGGVITPSQYEKVLGDSN